MGELQAGDGSVRAVTLREMAPGRYSATIDHAQPGAYQIRLVASHPDGRPFATLGAGAVVPQAGEFRNNRVQDQALLGSLARITGGRTNPTPAAVYDPTSISLDAPRDLSLPLIWLALALLPVDIGIRRLWSATKGSQRPRLFL
jgi:hypothetical protein